MMMEMDARLPCWQDKLKNPFAFAAFKCTEPWLQEYITLDVEAAFSAVGFESVLSESNTPTHTTFVGIKP